MLSSLPICFDVIDLVIQVVQALPKRNLGETMSELVLSERDGALHILTLNRPDRHNAMDDAMSALFRPRLADALQESASSAILLRAPGKSFRSGLDTPVPCHRPPVRQGVLERKSVSVRVDLGAPRHIKKKK